MASISALISNGAYFKCPFLSAALFTHLLDTHTPKRSGGYSAVTILRGTSSSSSSQVLRPLERRPTAFGGRRRRRKVETGRRWAAGVIDGVLRKQRRRCLWTIEADLWKLKWAIYSHIWVFSDWQFKFCKRCRLIAFVLFELFYLPLSQINRSYPFVFLSNTPVKFWICVISRHFVTSQLTAFCENATRQGINAKLTFLMQCLARGKENCNWLRNK